MHDGKAQAKLRFEEKAIFMKVAFLHAKAPALRPPVTHSRCEIQLFDAGLGQVHLLLVPRFRTCMEGTKLRRSRTCFHFRNTTSVRLLRIV